MFPALMLIGSVMSAGMQLMAGVGAQQSAELQAFNIENERILSEAETRQRSNDRLFAWRNNKSANIAYLASTRDVGGVGRHARTTSVGAFLEEQKQIAAQDVKRSDTQGMMESLKYTSMAGAARAEGRAAMASAVVGAFTTIVSAAAKYNEVRY